MDQVEAQGSDEDGSNAGASILKVRKGGCHGGSGSKYGAGKSLVLSQLISADEFAASRRSLGKKVFKRQKRMISEENDSIDDWD